MDTQTAINAVYGAAAIGALLAFILSSATAHRAHAGRRSSRRRDRAAAAKFRADCLGVALFAALGLTLAGAFYACYLIDAANGITVSESLESAGL